MVQGKSPKQKRNHAGVDRPSSSDLHQGTGSRVGADLEKKLKKVRSTKISDFGSLQHSPTMDFQFKKTTVSTIRNYMKPTRSSDARKGNLRATVTSPAITDKKRKKSSGTWKNSNSFLASSSSSSSSSAASVKKCSAVSSCAKKKLNRATCSSTLKDSKFPAALVIDPKGTSKMRVCPYTYCSLNGHMHELSSPPPPLKCFISESRRILRNQRSMDIETLFSVKTRDNEEERVGEERVNDIIEIPSDLFAGIYYRMPPEEIIGEKIKCSEINNQEKKYQEQNCVIDESQFFYVLDQTSERSRDHLVDFMENLLEYVEVDDEGEAREDYEFEENGDAKNSGIESIDMNCEAEHVSEEEEFETEHSLPETANILEHVEVDDEGKAPEEFEFEENGDAKHAGIESSDMYCEAEHVSEEEEFETEHSSPETADILEYVEVDSEGKAQEGYEFDEKGDARNTAGIEAMDMDCEAEDDSKEDESETEHSSPLPACLQPSADESGNLEAKNGTPETKLNASGIALKEAGGRWKIRRKATTEEFEQAKEFNPKQPNFLPLEPDPEDEKVDLRHQMMDGRRSAEEWMIDYALQHAVTRLGDRARKKKKVALLVEAFETVVPMHTCETPVRHGTSSFTNLSFIQACS